MPKLTILLFLLTEISRYMTKNLFLILFAAVLAVASLQANAQDPAFSQFYANPLYLNPAFAGSDICPRMSLNFRDQWPGIGKTYVTYSASYDQYVDKGFAHLAVRNQTMVDFQQQER